MFYLSRLIVYVLVLCLCSKIGICLFFHRIFSRADISTAYKMIDTFSWYINFALKADIHIKCHHIWLFLLLEWPFALISNLMKSILSKKTRNAWAIPLNWYIENREGIALKIVPFHQNIYIISNTFVRKLPR